MISSSCRSRRACCRVSRREVQYVRSRPIRRLNWPLPGRSAIGCPGRGRRHQGQTSVGNNMPRREPLRSLRTSRRRDTEHPQRLLERLLGRRTDALTNFFTNLGIVLRHLQNGVVFLQREALVGDSLCQGINGLIQNALLIGGGRRRYPLLIVLLETGHPLDGGCRRVKLLVRDVRRLLRETGRRRLDLSVCCGDEENPRGKQQDSSGRTHQNSHNCLLCTLRPLAMSKWCENTVGRKPVRGKSGSS